MAFSLFKKTNYTDTIFENGNIYTQDLELPWAEAVCVKDGKIIAVGDSNQMEEMIGPDTERIDLKGRFMYPGFIDVHRSHSLKLFTDKYCDLSKVPNPEELIPRLQAYAFGYLERDVIFGYGYNEKLLEGFDLSNPDWPNPLDKIRTDKPIILLADTGFTVWTNKIAKDIAMQFAEEYNLDSLTPQFILNTLLPYQVDEFLDDFDNYQKNLSEHGFTTTLDLASPDYIQGFYMDSAITKYSEETLRQRTYLSESERVPLIVRGFAHIVDSKMTQCTEVGDLIQVKSINIILDNENSLYPFDEKIFTETLDGLADRGLNFIIEATNQSDVELAYEGLDYLRNNGYPNTTYVIASDYKPEKEYMYAETALHTWGSALMNDYSITEPMSNEERLDNLTILPARYLGMEDKLGAIMPGMLADFTVYEEDILKQKKDFQNIQAVMTVVNGKIVYDLDSENDMEVYELLEGMHL